MMGFSSLGALALVIGRVRQIHHKSSPNSKNVVFYIEVFKKMSWTHKLYRKLSTEANCGIIFKDDGEISFDDKIEIMGPYGTSLGDFNNYSHALII